MLITCYRDENDLPFTFEMRCLVGSVLQWQNNQGDSEMEVLYIHLSRMKVQD